MSSPDPSVSAEQPSESRNRLVLAVYTAAIFVSALLLFSVQPLFTKMVLPRLGGSPAVWSVAMVFFQSLLLAGYAYAHLLMQVRNRVVPVAVHLVLLIAAFVILLITTLIIMWIAARIFRLSLLMYGKRPSLRALFGALRSGARKLRGTSRCFRRVEPLPRRSVRVAITFSGFKFSIHKRSYRLKATHIRNYQPGSVFRLEK